MKQEKLICIGCPLGCLLTIDMDGDTIVNVSGHTCRNGEKYAKKELTNPTRIVTSTVRVSGGALPIVSVKTAADIPKDQMFACIKALQLVEVPAPIQIGQVILANVANTGVDVVATKAIAEQGK